MDDSRRRQEENRNVTGRGQRVGHWKGRHGYRNHGRNQQHNHNQRHSQQSPRQVPKATSDFDPIEEWGEPNSQSITFAIQGCCHGALDEVYERMKMHEEQTGRKIDVLLCCGDFQSLRNTADYHSIAVPPKYRSMGSFWKYYAGVSHAPVLTIFIGGNHEASQPLSELYYGGWVAPNIYYLGAAGVVRVGGVRIGGMSGIYKSHDYAKGRFEQPPYDRSSLRSVYHVRNVDVQRMKCLSSLDIMLSHDWPQGIEQYGNKSALLRQKPFFRDEIERNDLGSRPNWDILNAIRPKWWFAAHLHVKFSATVRHTPNLVSIELTLVPSQIVPPPIKGNEISSDTTTLPNAESSSAKGNLPVPLEPIFQTNDDSSLEISEMTNFQSLETSQNCSGNDLTEQMTKFLSLDKCLPRRQYLSLLHVPFVPCSSSNKLKLEYDAEWLALLKKTYDWNTCGKYNVSSKGWDDVGHVTKADLDWIMDRLHGTLEIPNNFVPTVPSYCPNESLRPPLPRMGNPQTDQLLRVLELPHRITIPYKIEVIEKDENEIDLSLEDDIVDDDENKDSVVVDEEKEYNGVIHDDDKEDKGVENKDEEECDKFNISNSEQQYTLDVSTSKKARLNNANSGEDTRDNEEVQ
jgi:lariat debranching enzyme